MLKASGGMGVALGVALLLGLGGTGCGKCAGFDTLLLTAMVHSTSDFVWETMAGRSTKSGIPPEFVAWEAAIADASSATPSSSVLSLNGPGGHLYLDVPLPLTAGQTMPIVREDGLGNISFENVGPPRDSLGARFEDDCTTAEPVDQAACLAFVPLIEGTAQVVSDGPLVIHLDFTIEAWPGAVVPPHLVVDGDLVFSATRGRACPND